MDSTWIAGGIALALLIVVGILGRRAWRTRGREKHARAAAQRGHAGEAEAAADLEALGFSIIERHPVARYDLWVDDAPRSVRMTADYLVSRGGDRWIVEVKTGARARPTDRLTRRQLLEYALHYPVAGVYLYAPDRGELHRVEFPSEAAERSSEAPERSKWLAVAALAGMVLGFGVGLLAH